MNLNSVLCILVILYISESSGFHGLEGRSRSNSKKRPKFLWTRLVSCPYGSLVDGISLLFSNQDALVGNVKTSSSRRSSLQSRSLQTPIKFRPVLGVNISCLYTEDSESSFNFQYFPPRFENSSLNTNDYSLNHIQRCHTPSVEDEVENFSATPRKYGMIVGTQAKFVLDYIAEMDSFCNYEGDLVRINSRENDPNFLADQGIRRKEPNFCPWGYYVCGVKLRFDASNYFIFDVSTDCCIHFQESIGWRSYRGATEGRVLSSFSSKLDPDKMEEILQSPEPETHYSSHFDSPYFYNWDFCPVGSFVTGIQGQLTNRQFRLSCSDISVPAPRQKAYLDSAESALSLSVPYVVSQWDIPYQLTHHTECDGGVAIGMQVLYTPSLNELQGLRIFCSHTTESPDELKYVKVIFPPKEERSRGKKSKVAATAIWGPAAMCKRGEALCGWKVKHICEKSDYSPAGTEHIKVKCCQVPPIAEICSPYDKYELVLECDARGAFADTTCQYTLTEGLTISESVSDRYSVSESFREALSNEYSLTDASLLRVGQESVSSQSESNNTINSETNSKSTGNSTSTLDTNDSSVSASNKQIAGTKTGVSRGKTDGITVKTARESTTGDTLSIAETKLLGTSKSTSATNTTGSSENHLNTYAAGSSISDSRADTVGSTVGVVAAHTENSGTSNSQGNSQSQFSSHSSSSQQSRRSFDSSSDSFSLSVGLEAKASANFLFGSASVSTNIQSKYSTSQYSERESRSSHSTSNTRTHTSSSNAQETVEQSRSEMNQHNTEEQKSNTATSVAGSNLSNTTAAGGEIKSENSETVSETQKLETSLNTGRQASNSETLREGEEVSGQISFQANEETNKATHNTLERKQNIGRQVGGQRQDSISVSLMKNQGSSSSRGASYSNSQSVDRSSSQTGRKGNQEETMFTTGYYWTKTSERTWRKETSSQVSMVVPAGTRTKLYQVVGYCAHFQARTNNFKRIDDGRLPDDAKRDPVIYTHDLRSRKNGDALDVPYEE